MRSVSLTSIRSRLPLLAAALLAACTPAQDEARPGEKGLGEKGPARPADPRDSVLLITLDTTRADHLGCYGAPPDRTPTLDRLAADGVVFERALTVTPVTLPSHTSILSGRYPIHHGVRDNGIFRAEDELLLLAEMLRPHGFTTAAFVSSYILSAPYGLDQGFDHFDDAMPASGGRAVGNVERRAAQTVNAAIEWLQAAPPDPWFLWLHFYDPHHPYAAPGATPADARTDYAEEIRYTDRQIARFLAAYDEDDRLDRTLVVVTADHGEGLGEHREEYHGLFLYDATMRVPLILRHPRLAPGRRVGGQVVVVDIVPTVLDFLALPAAPEVAGSSLLLDLGADRPPPWHDAYLETQLPYYYLGLAAVEGVSTPAAKYIRAPRPELYAWPDDPGELDDLYAEGSPEVEAASRRLDTLRAGAGPLDLGPNRELEQSDLARLALLGYVTESDAGATNVDPKDYLEVIEYRKRARQALQAKQYAEAEEWIGRSLAVCPDDASTRALLGEAYLWQDRIPEAIAELEVSLRRRPDLAGTAQNLARAYRKIGEWEKAVEAYATILASTPDVTSAAIEAFDLCVEHGDLVRARRFLAPFFERPHLGDRDRERVAERRRRLENLERSLRGAGEEDE